jgi:hypothetical protein
MTTDNRVEDFQAIVDRLHVQIEKDGDGVTYEVVISKCQKAVNEQSGNHCILSESGTGEKLYGYAKSYPVIKNHESVIFRQTVHKLDLSEVVKAVNGIK